MFEKKTELLKYGFFDNTYFACNAKLIRPAAIGADADVPVNILSHFPFVLLVLKQNGKVTST